MTRYLWSQRSSPHPYVAHHFEIAIHSSLLVNKKKTVSRTLPRCTYHSGRIRNTGITFIRGALFTGAMWTHAMHSGFHIHHCFAKGQWRGTSSGIQLSYIHHRFRWACLRRSPTSPSFSLCIWKSPPSVPPPTNREVVAAMCSYSKSCFLAWCKAHPYGRCYPITIVRGQVGMKDRKIRRRKVVIVNRSVDMEIPIHRKKYKTSEGRESIRFSKLLAVYPLRFSR